MQQPGDHGAEHALPPAGPAMTLIDEVMAFCEVFEPVASTTASLHSASSSRSSPTAAVCTGEGARGLALEPQSQAVSSRLEGHLDGRSPAAVPAFRPLPVSDIDIGTSGSIAETSTHQQLQRGVADLAASLQHVAQQRADAAVAHTHASLELRVGRLESQLAEVRMTAERNRAAAAAAEKMAAAAAESMSQQFGAQLAAMQRQIDSLQLQLGAADVGAAEDTTGERAELPEPGSGAGGAQEGC